MSALRSELSISFKRSCMNRVGTPSDDSSCEARARARSIARASRLLVLNTRIEEALVRTAGATIRDSAANGLVVGSLISEYEGSARPFPGCALLHDERRLRCRA